MSFKMDYFFITSYFIINYSFFFLFQEAATFAREQGFEVS